MRRRIPQSAGAVEQLLSGAKRQTSKIALSTLPPGNRISRLARKPELGAKNHDANDQN